MFRGCWFLLLCILHLQYELTTSTESPTLTPFTPQPTPPTSSPTHQPTPTPTRPPSLSPTKLLESDQQMKIIVDVILEGINDICEEEKLNTYEVSLVDVFIAASGVSHSDIDETEITDCNILEGNVTLTYKMLSDNSRSRNTVTKRIKTGDFVTTYQANLDLVFTDVEVEVKNAILIEADPADEETSERDPFKDFFSAYFGLGVIILAVSVLWCFLLRADEGDVDKIRLKQLREEKRRFEEKYGVIEEDSVEADERDIPKAVELAGTTKASSIARETGETEKKTQPPPSQAQVQVNTEQEKTHGEPKEPETKPAENTYRASVVNEVKHTGKPEERASLDFDQIKDPGKKRRKTQEYLNNLWDDKNDAKEARGAQEAQEAQEDKDTEEVSEEETDED